MAKVIGQNTKMASKTDRVASYIGRSSMKRDRGYETNPCYGKYPKRGTDSPVK